MTGRACLCVCVCLKVCSRLFFFFSFLFFRNRLMCESDIPVAIHPGALIGGGWAEKYLMVSLQHQKKKERKSFRCILLTRPTPNAKRERDRRISRLVWGNGGEPVSDVDVRYCTPSPTSWDPFGNRYIFQDWFWHLFTV
ncbi:hypothetical protein B0T19DRAFT_419265 [Cercophora scortea]|uniref:Uncharacterized protein n=1 Tax=Cercophora scortea TaxID=314031 RepID=A0AAE0MJD5_9PEZI|nr:hypothetical protein B0T19DRAFT_419265 [Cercophora scortea]